MCTDLLLQYPSVQFVSTTLSTLSQLAAKSLMDLPQQVSADACPLDFCANSWKPAGAVTQNNDGFISLSNLSTTSTRGRGKTVSATDPASTAKGKGMIKCPPHTHTGRHGNHCSQLGCSHTQCAAAEATMEEIPIFRAVLLLHTLCGWVVSISQRAPTCQCPGPP